MLRVCLISISTAFAKQAIIIFLSLPYDDNVFYHFRHPIPNMENQEDNLLQTGLENSMTFRCEWEKHLDIPGFLHDHEYIPVRGSNVPHNELAEGFDIYPDIDGITIEWKDIAGTSHPFHHLFLIPRGEYSLKNVYSWLRKHEDLTKYTSEGRHTLRNCVGAQIFTDSGWEYVISLLPKLDSKIILDSTVIKKMTMNWFQELKSALRLKLIESIPGHHVRHTLDKNNLNDLSQIFILPGDSSDILKMLQECIDLTVKPQGFRSMVFSYRFGEKNRERVHLPIRNLQSVSKVCVHVGISLEPCLENESLLWSRNGIQSVIGCRGTLTTACGLYESANFQTNLDGSQMDISFALRSISKFPEYTHFFQLYADLPHRYPKTRYHPVSAAIIIGEGLRAHSDSLLQDAKSYISEAMSNFMKFTNSVCRLEYVMELPVIAQTVDASDFISIDNLYQLLNDHPLIVPFSDNNFIDCVKKIGHHLCCTLQSLLEQYEGTSCGMSVWQAYQYELTIEKLLWGHPLNFISNPYAVNLGPGIGTPSRADRFGFLKLENKFSCCVDERSMPPVKIFSANKCVQDQIFKIYGFWDYLNGSYVVIGRRLIEVLLQDLYEVGSCWGSLATFISSLKDGIQSRRVVGVTSKATLANKLSSVTKCKFPMVFLILKKMVLTKEKDMEQAIMTGIETHNLNHFPAFRNRDQHGHPCLYWHVSFGVWVISDPNYAVGATIDVQANLMSGLVLDQLETRKLCFTRSLTGEDFPWIVACLRKLDEQRLQQTDIVLVLTFVTCIALLESGRFIDYNNLKKIVQDMPICQFRLRLLEIQSKFLLNNVKNLKLYRLHPSIPRQRRKTMKTCPETLDVGPPASSNLNEAVDLPESDTVPLINDDPDYRQENQVNRDAENITRHLPANQCGRWTSQELAILQSLRDGLVEGTPVLNVYRKFQAECTSLEIPDRSYASFRAKFRRLCNLNAQT